MNKKQLQARETTAESLVGKLFEWDQHGVMVTGIILKVVKKDKGEEELVYSDNHNVGGYPLDDYEPITPVPKKLKSCKRAYSTSKDNTMKNLLSPKDGYIYLLSPTSYIPFL